MSATSFLTTATNTAATLSLHQVDDGQQILTQIINLLRGGIGFLGAAMVVWGAVTIGINVHNGASGNGSAIASGVGILVGGVIISAAAVYFGTLDTSWISA